MGSERKIMNSGIVGCKIWNIARLFHEKIRFLIGVKLKVKFDQLYLFKKNLQRFPNYTSAGNLRSSSFVNVIN